MGTWIKGKPDISPPVTGDAVPVIRGVSTQGHVLLGSAAGADSDDFDADGAAAAAQAAAATDATTKANAAQAGAIAASEPAGGIATHAALTSGVHGISAAVAQVLDDLTLAAALATLGGQPLHAALTAIAGLAPSNDDILQRKSNTWVSRTVAQYLADLGLGSLYQPLHAELTALAALTGQTFGRSLITLTNAAALLAAAGAAAAAHNHNASDINAGTLAAARGGLAADMSGVTGLVKATAGVGALAVPGTDYGRYEGFPWMPCTHATAISSARRYHGPIHLTVANSNSALTANRLYLIPGYYGPMIGQIHSLMTEVTAGVALSLLRLGAYASGSDGLPTGTPIIESGNLDGDGTPAVQTYTPGSPVPTTRGAHYWLALCTDGAISVRGGSTAGGLALMQAIGVEVGATAALSKCMYVAHTFGAFPNLTGASFTQAAQGLIVFWSFT